MIEPNKIIINLLYLNILVLLIKFIIIISILLVSEVNINITLVLISKDSTNTINITQFYIYQNNSFNTNNKKIILI